MLDTFPICGVHLQPGQFSTRIASTDTSDFRLFVLMDSVEYMSQAGTLYRIPKLAQSDLASIPHYLWSELPPQGEDGAEYGLAAFGHDSAYRDTLLVWPENNVLAGAPIPNDNTGWIKATLSKFDCDLLLKEMMLACLVAKNIALIIYEGVNFAGSAAFNKDRS